MLCAVRATDTYKAMTHAQITIARGDSEVLVNVTGRFIHGTPHEPGEVDDITCAGLEGGEIFLDSEEESQAFDALLWQARNERDSRAVDAQIDEMRDTE